MELRGHQMVDTEVLFILDHVFTTMQAGITPTSTAQTRISL